MPSCKPLQFLSKQMNEDDNAFNKSISKNKNKIFEKYLIKDIVFLAIITCCTNDIPIITPILPPPINIETAAFSFPLTEKNTL